MQLYRMNFHLSPRSICCRTYNLSGTACAPALRFGNVVPSTVARQGLSELAMLGIHSRCL
jgi:hypothetical protein